MTTETRPRLPRPSQGADRASRPAFAWLLTVCGGIGLLASAVLLVEKIALLRDPAYVPSCSINPVLSCGSIMTTPQAEAFGFPNPLLGVAGFSVVTTVGVALFAGARPARWFWLGLQAGTTAGVVFVHWLIVQSLYRIGALCPYCMVVWVVTIALFVAITSHNVRSRAIPAPSAATCLTAYAPTLVVAWLLVIAAFIAVRFWDYWSMLLRAGLPPLAWVAAGGGLYLAILAAVLVHRKAARRPPSMTDAGPLAGGPPSAAIRKHHVNH